MVDAITKQSVAACAYRTLGVSAVSGQAAIDGAARRMRIWTDPGKIPPTAWDLPALGPISRTRPEVEWAVTRLREPSARLAERMLWYHAPAPTPGGALWATDDAAPVQRHDAAVRALHEALWTDLSGAAIAQWNRVLKYLEGLAADSSGVRWLQEVERAGGFDKVAVVEDVVTSARLMLGRLAAGIGERAQASMLAGNWETGAALAQLLHRKRDSYGSVAHVQLLDKLEDALDGHCTRIDGLLRDKLRSDDANRAPYFKANRAVTDEAVEAYGAHVSPLLEVLQKFSIDEPGRQVRARAKVGKLLTLISLGWEWSGQHIKAEDTLHEVLKLVRGTQDVAEALAMLERIEPLAKIERARHMSWQLAPPGQTAPKSVGPTAQPQVAKTRAEEFWDFKKERPWERWFKTKWPVLLLPIGTLILVQFLSQVPAKKAPAVRVPEAKDPFFGLENRLPPRGSDTRPSPFAETSRER